MNFIGYPRHVTREAKMEKSKSRIEHIKHVRQTISDALEQNKAIAFTYVDARKPTPTRFCGKVKTDHKKGKVIVKITESIEHPVMKHRHDIDPSFEGWTEFRLRCITRIELVKK